MASSTDAASNSCSSLAQSKAVAVASLWSLYVRDTKDEQFMAALQQDQHAAALKRIATDSSEVCLTRIFALVLRCISTPSRQTERIVRFWHKAAELAENAPLHERHAVTYTAINNSGALVRRAASGQLDSWATTAKRFLNSEFMDIAALCRQHVQQPKSRRGRSERHC